VGPQAIPSEFFLEGFRDIFAGLALVLAAFTAVALIAILALCRRELSGN